MTRFLHSPKYIGVFYVAVIFAFALLYFVCENFWCEPLSLIQSVYFSVVTITTLGYGDITPSSYIARLFTAVEAVIGVLSIGLFLNATAHRAIENKENKRKEAAKQHLIAVYREFREDLSQIVLQCEAGHYGIDLGKAERIADYMEFRKEYSASEFYSVMSGMQSNPQFIEDIFVICGVLSQQIDNTILAVQSENQESISTLTRFARWPHRVQRLDVFQNDPAKYVGEYVYQTLANYSKMTGPFKNERIEEAIIAL